jgi:hypothetical protein
MQTQNGSFTGEWSPLSDYEIKNAWRFNTGIACVFMLCYLNTGAKSDTVNKSGRKWEQTYFGEFLLQFNSESSVFPPAAPPLQKKLRLKCTEPYFHLLFCTCIKHGLTLMEEQVWERSMRKGCLEERRT